MTRLRKINPTEHQEQVTLFRVAERFRHLYMIPDRPEESYLDYMFAVPNGAPMSLKQRLWMMAEGLKPGVLDVWLMVPRGGYHGLIVEMKTKTGRVSKDQKRWLSFQRSRGYRVEVCRGREEAWEVIKEYMEGK